MQVAAKGATITRQAALAPDGVKLFRKNCPGLFIMDCNLQFAMEISRIPHSVMSSGV